MGQECWWIGGSNQIESFIFMGVLKDSEGIFERVISVGNSVGGGG